MMKRIVLLVLVVLFAAILVLRRSHTPDQIHTQKTKTPVADSDQSPKPVPPPFPDDRTLPHIADCLAQNCGEVREADAIQKIQDLDKNPDTKLSEENFQALISSAKVSSPLALAVIDVVFKFGSTDQMVSLLHQKEMSAVAKAQALQTAFSHADERLQVQAEQTLNTLVSAGTLAEVSALLTQVTRIPEAAKELVAKAQTQLCRFQNRSNDMEFEMLKARFAYAFSEDQNFKPWPVACKG